MESHNLDRDSLWARFLGLDEPHGDELNELEPRTVMAAAPIVLADVLAAPAGLAATATGPTSVSLRWPAAVSSATGYKVMRAPATGSFVQVGTIAAGGALAFTDTTVSSNSQFRYQIIAFNANAQSAPSNTASVATPLAAPIDLRATILSNAVVQLQWQGKDATATGYVISRSVAGGAWANLVRLNGVSASSFIDMTVARGTVYSYRIQAVTATGASAASAAITAAVPVAPPAVVRLTVLPTNHVLTWSAGDTKVVSYSVQRATGSGSFVTLATVGRNVTTFTDSAISGGATYSYRILANGTGVPSGTSGTLRATAALRAATAPAATRSDAGVALTWNAANSTDVSYRVQRSFDGVSFTQIATTSSRSYTDASPDSSQRVWYRVQAFLGAASSAVSASTVVAAAPVTPPAPAPTPTPTPGTGSIAVTSRFTNESVVTLNGGASSISVTAAGATLRIMSGSTLVSEISMPSALFIYDRGGTNAISIDASVSIRTIITSVGGGATSISSSASNVSAWIDTTDSFSGSGSVHSIGSLAGGVSKAAGAALANPSDSGATRDAGASLWGSGPSVADVNQGAVGDCYFLATLGAFAVSSPGFIADRAVDLGDGTYIVQFNQGVNPVFVRVSDDIPTTNGTSYRFARPGASGSVWVPIMEKAFAYFRTGANTYSSISGGWMGDVFTAFGVASSSIGASNASETALFSFVSTALASGKGVTFGTTVSSPTLVGGHAYTVTAVRRDASGQAIYTVRNPWGVSGTSAEDSSGYAELTYAQMRSNFTAGVRAA